MSTSSKLDHALKLARQGFPIFPLVPDGKTPAFPEWQALATRDERAIRRWWGPNDLGPEFDSDYNIGVATGAPAIVVDVDSYKGADATALGLPETLVVRTARGGEHRYFAAPRGIWIGNTTSRLAPGIDTRGHGGYVVGPGSTIGGQRYEITREAPLAPLPIDLEMELAQPAPVVRSSVPLEPACELDTPETIDFARRWLAEHAPEAIEGQGGREATKKVAQVLGDFGLSPDAVFDLMTEAGGWDAQKAAPSWVGSGQGEDLRRLIEDMLTNHRNEPLGCAHVAVFGASDVFEPVEIGAPRRRKGLRLISARELMNSPASTARPLIKGLLLQGTCSVLYGPSGEGKTFVAFDLALSVATGSPWNGRRTTKAGVLYIAGEGMGGLRKRLEAWTDARKWESDLPFFLTDQPMSLLSPADCDLAALAAQEAAEMSGVPTGLIVIDTLSRALAGGDENSSVDMGKVQKNVERLRQATGAHVLLVHHSGKDAAKGARGHSILRAAVDTEIEVNQKTLRVTKQRDIEPIDQLCFDLRSVPLGHDEDGDPVSTCVVEWRTGAEDVFTPRLTGKEQQVVDLLLAQGPGHQQFTTADVNSILEQGGLSLSRPHLSNLRRSLMEKGVLADCGEKGSWRLNSEFTEFTSSSQLSS